MDLRPKCVKCGKNMYPTEMRMSPDSKGYLCGECYKFEGNLKPTTSKPKFQEKPKPEQSSSDKIDYVCDKCKFKFSRRKDLTIEKCPYCGGNRFHERKLDSSNRLVRNNTEL
ncbi:MAG: hypothetical protein AB7V77_01865 [Candidatus Woesearchaeota archaeon]